MSIIQSVCVFLGSSLEVDECYKEIARDTGAALAAAGLKIVYGASSQGLMNIMSHSALDTGGEVIGVIPEFLIEKEGRNERLTETHLVTSMAERKQKFTELSDAFLVLPGGFGTLDELFVVLTERLLSRHDKPVYILNTNGYWDALESLLDNVIGSGFGAESYREAYAFVDTIPEAIALMSVGKRP